MQERPLGASPRGTARIVRRALVELSRKRGHAVLSRGIDLGLRAVSRARMRDLNRRHRGVDAATDVLSFPAYATLAEVPARGPRPHIGDIVVCPAVARGNARRAGRSPSSEIAVLVLHGLLHLLGYDHETDDGAMRRTELALWRRLAIPALGDRSLL